MEEVQAPGIGTIAAKYGLIDGVLAFALFLVQTHTTMNQSRVWTVITLAILVVLMVLAHREFKRTHKGMMTYPQGLGSGTLLAVIGAVVSSILTFFYVSYINTGYLGAVMHAQQVAMQQRGISAAQAQQAMAITGYLMTPVGIVVIALVGGVIFGFIVALVVSIFTQKADPRAVV